jgi:hypothetical protein
VHLAKGAGAAVAGLGRERSRDSNKIVSSRTRGLMVY